MTWNLDLHQGMFPQTQVICRSYTCLTGQVYKYPVGYAIYKPLNPVYPMFVVF